MLASVPSANLQCGTISNALAKSRKIKSTGSSESKQPLTLSINVSLLNERIEYKLLSLSAYKVFTTSQPDYLHNLISVQSTIRTRSSSFVALARPSVSSSLQITNRSLTYASPYLWSQLPSSFRQPHSVHCPPGSPHPAHITSLQSPPSLSSPITAYLSLDPDLKLVSFTNPFIHPIQSNTSVHHYECVALSSIVTLIPSGLTSRILTCTELKGHCFACFSFWLRVLD